MAEISLTGRTFYDYIFNYILGDSASGFYKAFYPTNFSSADARFRVCKGTIPTLTELNKAGADFRSSDVLIDIASSDYAVVLSTVDYGTVLNTLPLSVVTNSLNTGTAAWWYWDPDYTATHTRPILAGTATGVGGGGDLEMSDLNVVTTSIFGMTNTLMFDFDSPITTTY